MQPQVISIGEVLVELMRTAVGQPLDQPGDFRGPFASGAPAIFAVAAARLGALVGFIGGVGDDAFGRLLRTRFEVEDVDVGQMQIIEGHSTGVAFVAYTADGGREFVFHMRHAAAGALAADRLDPAYFAQVRWLHISGSALTLNPSIRAACQRALELTLETGGMLSFDPNLRPELMGVKEARRVMAPYIEAASLLLPTVEEAHALTGTADDDTAAQALMTGRDCVVALKRGAAGCSLFSEEERVDVPGFTVEEIDPTGAGDCFNAAAVMGLSAGWPLERIGRFACAAGALAVTYLGPMEGAPTRAEVEALLKA